MKPKEQQMIIKFAGEYPYKEIIREHMKNRLLENFDKIFDALYEPGETFQLVIKLRKFYDILPRPEIGVKDIEAAFEKAGSGLEIQEVKGDE